MKNRRYTKKEQYTWSAVMLLSALAVLALVLALANISYEPLEWFVNP